MIEKRKCLRAVRCGFSVVLVLCTAAFVVATINWPMSGDQALMHYMASALQGHQVPYLQEADYNFPGAYVPDWLATSMFGSIDLPWRLYDLGLLFGIWVAMHQIVSVRCRPAAIWAACLFALIHGRDGVEQVGQRDLTGTALVIIATALLVSSPGSRKVAAVGSAAFLVGAAALVKPTFFLFLALPLIWVIRESRQRSADCLRIIMASVTPSLLTGVWLWHHHALGAFGFSVTVLARYHASLGQQNWRALLYGATAPVLPLIVGVLLVAALQLVSNAKQVRLHKVRTDEWILFSGMVAGLSCYLLQNKGFAYQRYPFLAFALLLSAVTLCKAMDREGLQQPLAVAICAGVFCTLAPSCTWKAAHYDWQHRQVVQALTSDLKELESKDLRSLSGNIQCIDTASGCLEALYRLRLLNSSPVMYDEFLFGASTESAVQGSRETFLRNVNHMEVIVVTEDSFPVGLSSYAKLAAWPDFISWLDQHYVLVRQFDTQTMHTVGRPYRPPGYRLYVRRR